MACSRQSRACANSVITTGWRLTVAMLSPPGWTSGTQRSPRTRRDTIVSFLYRIHRDALMQTPGARVYYEDHADFNEAFDLENKTIRLGNLEFLPSRVLFHVDREAYRAALYEHRAERVAPENGDDQAAPGDNWQEAG